MWCPASSQLKWTKGQVRGQKSFLSWLTLSIAWFLHACFHKSIYSLHFYGCKKGLQLILVVVHSVMSNSLWPHGLQHTRHACPSPSPRACSNSCPLSQWCHPTISSSVAPFSSCLQCFPRSGSFPMSQLFTPGGQSIGVLASASVPPMNSQDWFPLGWTGLTLILRVQGTLKSLLQHHSSKASILQHSAFFIVQLLYPYMTTRYRHPNVHRSTIYSSQTCCCC